MRTVSCKKRYKNWYKWKLWQGIPPAELHPFIILKKRFGVSQENVHLRAWTRVGTLILKNRFGVSQENVHLRAWTRVGTSGVVRIFLEF